MQDMGSEAGTTPKKDMGTKVDIVTCTAWEHLTAWHKGILNILDDNPLTTGLVQGDVVAVLLIGAIMNTLVGNTCLKRRNSRSCQL